MVYQIPPEVVKELIQVREMTMSSALAGLKASEIEEAVEPYSLTEEDIQTLQQASLKSSAAIISSEAWIPIVQQQAELQKELVKLASVVENANEMRVQSLKPLFETEAVKSTIEQSPEPPVKESEIQEESDAVGATLAAEQNGPRVAWQISLLYADGAMRKAREQVDQGKYTDSQYKAGGLLLALMIFASLFGAPQAAGVLLGEVFSDDQTFTEAWRNLVSQVEDDLEDEEM